MADLFADVETTIDDIVGPAVVAAAEAARDRLRAVAPGVVQDAIVVRTEGDGPDTVATVHAGGLTPVIVQGAKPHRIPSRTKRALAWRGGEHPVGSVRHPGTSPNDFIARAETSIEEAVDLVGEEALDAIADVLDAELEAVSV